MARYPDEPLAPPGLLERLTQAGIWSAATPWPLVAERARKSEALLCATEPSSSRSSSVAAGRLAEAGEIGPAPVHALELAETIVIK